MAWGKSDRIGRWCTRWRSMSGCGPELGDVGSQWFGEILADAMRSVNQGSGDLYVHSEAV